MASDTAPGTPCSWCGTPFEGPGGGGPSPHTAAPGPPQSHDIDISFEFAGAPEPASPPPVIPPPPPAAPNLGGSGQYASTFDFLGEAAKVNTGAAPPGPQTQPRPVSGMLPPTQPRPPSGMLPPPPQRPASGVMPPAQLRPATGSQARAPQPVTGSGVHALANEATERIGYQQASAVRPCPHCGKAIATKLERCTECQGVLGGVLQVLAPLPAGTRFDDIISAVTQAGGAQDTQQMKRVLTAGQGVLTGYLSGQALHELSQTLAPYRAIQPMYGQPAARKPSRAEAVSAVKPDAPPPRPAWMIPALAGAVGALLVGIGIVMSNAGAGASSGGEAIEETAPPPALPSAAKMMQTLDLPLPQDGVRRGETAVAAFTVWKYARAVVATREGQAVTARARLLTYANGESAAGFVLAHLAIFGTGGEPGKLGREAILRGVRPRITAGFTGVDIEFAGTGEAPVRYLGETIRAMARIKLKTAGMRPVQDAATLWSFAAWPYRTADDRLGQYLFPLRGLGAVAIPQAESLEDIDAGIFNRFAQESMASARWMVAVSGNFGEGKVKALLGGGPPERDDEAALPRPEQKLPLKANGQAPGRSLIAGWTMASNAPEAARVLVRELIARRLERTLVHAQREVHEVAMMTIPCQGFWIVAADLPGLTFDARQLATTAAETIGPLIAEGPDANELKAAVAGATHGYRRALQDPSMAAGAMLDMMTLAPGLVNPDDVRDGLETVRPEMIAAALKTSGSGGLPVALTLQSEVRR